MIEEQMPCIKNDPLQTMVNTDALASNIDFAELTHALPAGIIAIDTQGVVTYGNHVAQAILGTPLLGSTWLEVIERAFDTVTLAHGDLQLRDGRILHVTTSPMTCNRGQLLLLQDVTEVHALRQKASHYERLSSMGDLAAKLAHQVRTPLAGALLYANQLGKRDCSGENTEKFHGKLMARLRDIEAQVKAMLFYVKGGQTQQFHLQKIGELIDKVADGFDVSRYPLVKLSIKRKHFDQEILCHDEMLSGALQNCLQNAAEAAKEKVTITLKAMVNEGGIGIIVEDNGPGMPSSILAQAKESFYTTKAQGTGIGLSVANMVAIEHGGRLVIESQERVGTTVRFVLPKV